MENELIIYIGNNIYKGYKGNKGKNKEISCLISSFLFFVQNFHEVLLIRAILHELLVIV